MAQQAKKKFGKDLSFASTEAYNLLRTNIQFTLPPMNRGRIIGVTSSCPGEGKTYTSVNLACSIASLGKSVVIVDGDMRKPTVGRYLEVKSAPGLSNVLVDENLSVVTPSGVSEFLDCIPGGDIPPNPSELIGSEAMKKLLLKLASKYEFVFIDLPPVGVVSDALAVSPYLDGMVVVVRHGITKPRDLDETITRLELAKTNILGFVYNAYFHRRASYYYRSKDRYHYYYNYNHSHYGKKGNPKTQAAEVTAPEIKEKKLTRAERKAKKK